MKKEKAIEKYISIFGNYAKNKLRNAQSTKAGKKEVTNRYLDSLGLSDRNKSVLRPNIKVDREYLFMGNLFERINEIITAQTRLEDTFRLTIISKKPITVAEIAFNNKHSAKIKILRMRLEHQIKTLYILSTRMLSFLDWIENQYKKHPSPETKRILNKKKLIRKDILSTFSRLQKIRHEHEHEKFFDADDLNRIERIATTAYITKINRKKVRHKKDVFQEYLISEYKTVQKKYTKMMKDNIRNSDKYLNRFLSDLFSILLDHKNAFYIPYELKPESK